MKTIEERADEYVRHTKEIDEDVFISALRDAYIKGAEDQKEEDEKVRLKKSDDMTIEQIKREESFANWYLKNGKGTPTFSDAIEWERKRAFTDIYNILIEKACLWLKSRSEYLFSDDIIEGFKEFMNEIHNYEKAYKRKNFN